MWWTHDSSMQKFWKQLKKIIEVPDKLNERKIKIWKYENKQEGQIKDQRDVSYE